MQEINLSMPSGSGMVRVKVNGRIVAECFPGASLSRDDLETAVGAAHAARAACRLLAGALAELQKAPRKPDHVNATKARAGRFAVGLEDGMRGVTVAYPLEGVAVPDIPPSHDPSYMRGYSLGDAIRRAVAYANEGDPA